MLRSKQAYIGICIHAHTILVATRAFIQTNTPLSVVALLHNLLHDSLHEPEKQAWLIIPKRYCNSLRMPRYTGLEPRAESLLEQIGSWDDLVPASYSDTFCPRLHYGDSCVFLGDAAHAMSPQLGQGASTSGI